MLLSLASLALAAPAPALTNVQISRVTSSVIYNGEAITPAQTQTAQDHAGLLTIKVRETGYASFRAATIDGASMKMISKTAVVSGGIVIGYDCVWQYEFWSAGTGTVTVTSRNQSLPYNSITDRLYVK